VARTAPRKGEASTQPRGHLASHTPGRVRVRARHLKQHPELVAGLQDQLAAQPSIGHVHVNAATGSVLVHYDHKKSSLSDVLGALQDVGVLVGEVAGAGGDELPDLGGGHSSTATGVVDTIGDLDRRLSELTGRTVDLRLLFPLTLGTLGAIRVLFGGLGFTEVPAYILLWYAFDSFWKFHRESAPTGPADASEPTVPPTDAAAG
jgi:hypothetical protein